MYSVFAFISFGFADPIGHDNFHALSTDQSESKKKLQRTINHKYTSEAIKGCKGVCCVCGTGARIDFTSMGDGGSYIFLIAFR